MFQHIWNYKQKQTWRRVKTQFGLIKHEGRNSQQESHNLILIDSCVGFWETFLPCFYQISINSIFYQTIQLDLWSIFLKNCLKTLFVSQNTKHKKAPKEFEFLIFFMELHKLFISNSNSLSNLVKYQISLIILVCYLN